MYDMNYFGLFLIMYVYSILGVVRYAYYICVLYFINSSNVVVAFILLVISDIYLVYKYVLY